MLASIHPQFASSPSILELLLVPMSQSTLNLYTMHLGQDWESLELELELALGCGLILLHTYTSLETRYTATRFAKYLQAAWRTADKTPLESLDAGWKPPRKFHTLRMDSLAFALKLGLEWALALALEFAQESELGLALA